MKTSAQHQIDQERQAETRDHAERIVSVNEAYDAQALSLRCWKDLEAECNRQHRFATERQAVIDKLNQERAAIRLIVERTLKTTTNMQVHAAMNSVIHVLGKE